MKLQDFLKEAKLSPAEFAEIIGASERSIYAYTNGNRIPKQYVMRKIFKHTAKLVSANDFYNLGGEK